MKNVTTALAMVAADKACSVNLHTLRALKVRGLINLTVKTTRSARTVAAIDITATLTDAGRAAL